MATTPSEPHHDPRERLYAQYVTTHTHRDVDSAPIPALTPSIRRCLPYDRSTTVLDVGCGAGEMVQELHQAGYRRVRGIDVSHEQIRLAETRGINGVERADLRDHLRSNPRAYDVILALDVLEHFDRAEVLSVLDLIAIALKPNGRLIARTPNGVSPFAGRYRYGDLTHCLAYTSSSLRQALAATGFHTVRFFPVSPQVTGAASAVRAVAWHVIAALLKLALAAETGELQGHIVTQNLLVCAVAAAGTDARV